MTIALLSNLLLAHLLGDFFLQPKWMLRGKCEKHFKNVSLYLHAVLVGLLSWLVVFRLDFWPYLLALIVSHVIFDGVKNVAQKLDKNMFWPFVIDQIAHLVMIVVVGIIFSRDNDWTQFAFIAKKHVVLLPLGLSALVFLTRPVNIFIHELFEWNRKLAKEETSKNQVQNDIFDFSTDEGDKSRRMPNASSWIGAFERVLVFVFVYMGNYQAVGFIMAAKSILRFKESDGPRAEYVLVGTFVSVTIAVLCALLIKVTICVPTVAYS